MEWAEGIDLSTPSLGSWCSTPELRPLLIRAELGDPNGAIVEPRRYLEAPAQSLDVPPERAEENVVAALDLRDLRLADADHLADLALRLPYLPAETGEIERSERGRLAGDPRPTIRRHLLEEFGELAGHGAMISDAGGLDARSWR